MLALLVNLYTAFLLVGMGAFGAGTATIPLMFRVLVEDRGLLTTQQLSDFIALASMVPGPFSVDTAGLCGFVIAGPLGAVVSVMGLLTPPVILMTLVMVIFAKAKNIGVMNRFRHAVRPGAVALVSLAVIGMSRQRLVEPVAPIAAIAALTLGLLLWKGRQINPVLLVIAFGLVGMLVFG